MHSMAGPGLIGPGLPTGLPNVTDPAIGGIQVIPAMNYMPVSPVNNLPATRLYDRRINTVQIPRLYAMHSPPVGNLLQHRALLDSHWQKTMALTGYIQGVMALANNLSALQQGLQGSGVLPVQPYFDLLYQGAANTHPVSLYQNPASLPQVFVDHLPSYLDRLSAPLVNAMPQMQQFLPMALGYAGALQNEWQLNSQQLAFNGYPPGEIVQAAPMVYPLNDLGWLGSPAAGTEPPGAPMAFSADHPQSWGNRPGIYFAPTMMDAMASGLDSASSPLAENPAWPSFVQCYQQFYHPLQPTGYNLDDGLASVLPLADKVPVANHGFSAEPVPTTEGPAEPVGGNDPADDINNKVKNEPGVTGEDNNPVPEEQEDITGDMVLPSEDKDDLDSIVEENHDHHDIEDEQEEVEVNDEGEEEKTPPLTSGKRASAQDEQALLDKKEKEAAQKVPHLVDSALRADPGSLKPKVVGKDPKQREQNNTKQQQKTDRKNWRLRKKQTRRRMPGKRKRKPR